MIYINYQNPLDGDISVPCALSSGIWLSSISETKSKFFFAPIRLYSDDRKLNKLRKYRSVSLNQSYSLFELDLLPWINCNVQPMTNKLRNKAENAY